MTSVDGKFCYVTDFTFGDRVALDGDQMTEFTVTGFTFRRGSCMVEISYMHNSEGRSVWVEEYRLAPAEPPKSQAARRSAVSQQFNENWGRWLK